MTAVGRWLGTGWRLQVARVLALLVVVAITVFIYSVRDQTQALTRYGYAGAFLLSLVAYATVLLPAPGIAVVFALAGTGLSPLGIALAGGAGATLGELSGYLAGFGGRAIVERSRFSQRLTEWIQRRGMLTVFVFAAIPNPVFDMAGIIAGALKMSLARFTVAAFAGQFVKMLIIAYAGRYSIEWVERLLG